MIELIYKLFTKEIWREGLLVPAGVAVKESIVCRSSQNYTLFATVNVTSLQYGDGGSGCGQYELYNITNSQCFNVTTHSNV